MSNYTVDMIKNNKAVKRAYYIANSTGLRTCLSRGKLDKISAYTNYNLFCLSGFSKDCFLKSANKVHEYTKKEISRKEKIRVGFVVYSSQMWSCSKLYEYFDNDNRFEPFLILCKMKSYSNSSEDEMYNSSLEFFKSLNYKIIDTQAVGAVTVEQAGNPDILIYLTPYTTSLRPSCMNISAVALDKLCAYIPYSYMVSANDTMFDNSTFNLVWKFFCESRIYMNLLKEKCLFNGFNAVYTGFPGLDSLLEGKDKGIFKNPSCKKKIIYAPHFSIANHGIGFSTFDKNYLFMLGLAERTSESISWVIKPHPKLKAESVESGLFKNEKEYDEYIEKWNSLPNAKAVLSGSYADLFAESDAIILDSASFLVEYQFTGNPLLFLTNNRQRFNAFGNAVMQTVYKADGEDFNAIEDFVFRTVYGSTDTMSRSRKAFFDKELDYIGHNNGLTASEKIYKIIRSELSDEH